MPIPLQYNLHGKVAVVAGDGNGLTPIIAEALAEAGSYIFVVTEHQSIIDEIIPRVEKHGEKAIGIVCDSTDENQVRMAIDHLERQWPKIDILVNNYCTGFAKPFVSVEVDEFNKVIDRNLKSVFFMTREVGKRMEESGNGRIVNIISMLAERGLANSSVFCASQGAVLQLTRSLALEWGTTDIRVNALGIGWINDSNEMPQENDDGLLLRYIPLGRKGLPEEVVPLIVYLASDSCDFTTGHPIYIDGGLTARP